jgi:muconate cycloisomerase
LASLWAPLRLSAHSTPLRSSAAERLERIDVYALRYAMTGHFKFFTGPHGAKGRASVLVKITSESGQVGWGQSVPIARWSYETLETVEVVLRQYFAPALLGHDALDLDGAQARMSTAIAQGFSLGMPIARAGIDLALHDLAGKVAGKSVAELWGRKADRPLRLSWTLNPRSLEETESLVQAGLKRGYRDFNLKVSPDPEFDVALAKLVRALAPEAFLWTDANGGYAPETALAVAPQLADAGVDVLEAPMKPNQIQGYRDLKNQGALPILMDEGVVSPVELREFIKLGMLDGVAMKPSRCGGLQSARAQIELLEQHGLMWLGSGLTDPDLSLAATLQLYGAYHLQESAALNGPQFLTDSLLKQPLQVRDGSLTPPSGPGLGVEVDELKLAEWVARTAQSARSSARNSPAAADPLDLEWKNKIGKSIALFAQGAELWRLHIDPAQAHSYFHPLALPNLPSLTVDAPADHPWHHGLWFSWKYINGVNYWENAAGSDRPAGRTSWTKVNFECNSDFSARMQMDLRYTPPELGPVLAEHRVIEVSRPQNDGSYFIDWMAKFTALADQVVLDRTPLPGEPGGKIFGGYAGLSLRLANFEERRATSDGGPVQFNAQNRYRGRHSAFEYSGVLNDQPVGITVQDFSDNLNAPSPWYAIRSETMSFFTPAVICYGAKTLQRGQSFTLRYRIHIHPSRWDPPTLKRLQ